MVKANLVQRVGQTGGVSGAGRTQRATTSQATNNPECTPALLKSLAAQGVADKELSALLATDRVIPVAHSTTFDALRDVSPLLAARSGPTTEEDLSMRNVATKVAAAAAAEGDG